MIKSINERVYDRTNPSREGTAYQYDSDAFAYRVAWEDTKTFEWIDIDSLGAVFPPGPPFHLSQGS